MRRTLILAFGVIAYSAFLAAFLYLVAFVGNLQSTALTQTVPMLAELVPYSIDFGRETGPLPTAIVINLGLILLFGLQHSVMARSGFKSWLKRLLPESAERSVYVLIASAVLALLMWQWRPIPTLVWALEAGWAVTTAWAVFGAGFGIVLLSTFLIDHFELAGLKQVWMQFVGHSMSYPRFKTPLFYRFVRHPIYLGFLLAFWSAPDMTVGHMVFAAGMTVYILIGIRYEERDLVRHFGADYERYRERVPMLLPLPRRGAGA